jgi:hypothetical protein
VVVPRALIGVSAEPHNLRGYATSLPLAGEAVEEDDVERMLYGNGSSDRAALVAERMVVID